MQRIPEPELMTGLAQAGAYAAADFSASDQAFLERVQQLFPEGLGSRLLDLGCGPGNISFRLARSYPAATVLAVDGAPAMLDLARGQLLQELLRQPDLAERLRFVEAVLPDPALTCGASAVLSNSLLHHLHDPQVLWQAVAQLGAPGAFVYIQDLRRPASPDALEALVVSQTQGAPEVLRHDYRASLHAAFTVREVREQLKCAVLACACLAGLQVAPRQERYLEVWGRLG